MRFEPLFPYDEWLFSGQPLFVMAGVDYTTSSEMVRAGLRNAAKKRGLGLAIRYVWRYDGFVFQAYVPGGPVPVLPTDDQIKIDEETRKTLFS